ncbi:MAG: transglutaminase N-terminal domain-containing protein [Burkholderiaceae bacterium]
MSFTYKVQHKTSFSYQSNVTLSQQLLRLSPRESANQRVDSQSVLIDPSPMVRQQRNDYFGNQLIRVALQEPHRRLAIHANSTITVNPPDALDPEQSMPWESVLEAVRKPVTRDAALAAGFCFPSPYVDVPAGIGELTADVFTPGRPILSAVMALTTRIYSEFNYRGGVTDIWTPVSSVLEKRQGVCQDFAHLQIAAIRALGLPVRYISGYLLTHPAPGKPRLVGADESHAWLSVWSPEQGWIDFDPTNNSMPRHEHILLAWGRDYGDVSPIKGFIVGGGSHEIKVSVDVAPVASIAHA